MNNVRRVALAGMMMVTMLGWGCSEEPAPTPNKVSFATPSELALPSAYTHVPGYYNYTPTILPLLPRTHWMALQTFDNELPEGLPSVDALKAWNAHTHQDPEHPINVVKRFDCGGACLPVVRTAPRPDETLAMATEDCLTQDQVKQLPIAWTVWPFAAGVRVGKVLRVAVVDFSVSKGSCPIGRWSLRITDRVYGYGKG